MAAVKNLITDVAGLQVGNAEDGALKSGVTVLLCAEPSIASFHVMGGAPGTRETDLLEPHNTVQDIDAIVLSGGSAFGLDSASGVQAALRQMGRGFKVGPVRVPIVPAAILFDLINGGDKNWGIYPPYRELGYRATLNAGSDFSTGSVGAGAGALTAWLKGGLGSASVRLANGLTIGALVAVNAVGSATFGKTAHFRAAEFERNGEFGGLGLPSPFPQNSTDLLVKGGRTPTPGANTTIGIIATDAILTKAEAKRLAIAAHDGFAHALWPSHTPMDGDLVFAVATGKSAASISSEGFVELCAASASTMARAIARGVYDATAEDGDVMPVWGSLHPPLP